MLRATSLVVCLCVLVAVSSAFCAEVTEPPVFASENHQLNLLMIAKTKSVTLAGFQPEAWVYEVCPRSVAQNDQCPAGSATASPYGGVRLSLQAGDHLRIRFVNQLPPAPIDAEHAQEMPEMLGANPTNLHTHGLIVEPRRAGNGDPTYGDYVYVLGYSAGHVPGVQEGGFDYTDQPIDYDIYIPENHPSGFFWFHPHVHGLALNQVSRGLAGVITVGVPEDYLSDGPGNSGFKGVHNIRHLVLKDMQVEVSGEVVDQEDPDFCASDPSLGDGDDRKGSCNGQVYTSDTGAVVDHSGGQWLFTVNGQVYPEVTVQRGKGEVWRLLNASGSRSYALSLVDDKSAQPLQFQILSIDGISIDSAQPEAVDSLLAKSGGKAKFAACENAKGVPAVCATEISMMPSSRVEIWVSSRQADKATSATLMTRMFETGPDGDSWPAAKLAHVVFQKGGGNVSDTIVVAANAKRLLSAGVLGSEPKISLPGLSKAISFNVAKQLASGALKPDDASLAALVGDATVARELKSFNTRQLGNVRAQVQSVEDSNCKALPAGHKRRIFFGVPVNASFGLGYEEVDERGDPVPGTFKDLEAFDHNFVTVCLSLAPGNRPVTETWELVNVAGEDHNFHIHQTKFRVLPKNAPAGDAAVLMDNVPVPHGTPGCDGTIGSWRSGACVVSPVSVAIPFSQIGDFVYHCHILEHEDGGMMAHIRVVGN